MNSALIALVSYFSAGLIAILLLERLTGRVRGRLRDASYDTRDKLIYAGSIVIGTRTAIVVTLLALWIFWPFAIYGALSGMLIKSKEQSDEQDKNKERG